MAQLLTPDYRGVHPPCGNDAFPLVSDFPVFGKKFRLRGKFPQLLPFPPKNSDFHPPRISLVIDQKFRIFPLFSLFQYIFPYFAKIILSPTFHNVPLVFVKCSLRVFYIRTGRPCLTISLYNNYLILWGYWTIIFIIILALLIIIWFN